MNKKVSIIIPTYNYGRYLQETIQNLQEQTHDLWEAIIIDDGSNDGTDEIIKPFLQADSRIKYFKQKNKGVSAARNLGLQHAQGDYIQFLDADDMLSENKLSLQLSFFDQHPEVDISYTDNFYFLDGEPQTWYPDLEMEGRIWMPKLIGKGTVAINTLLKNNIGVVSSPLIRAKVLSQVSGFDTQIAHTEDWKFWISCALSNAYFHYFPHPKAYTLIRIHRTSVSQNRLSMQYGELGLRNWVGDQLKQMAGAKNELKQLEKLNHNRKKMLVKHVMYLNPLWDRKHLIAMAEVAGWPAVIGYFFRALNHKRKKIRNEKGSRHNHPLKSQQ
jgi:glycosyltransferase involved in cell wall biosynthesis